MNTENVRWIINCSCSDLNYKTKVPLLTDEELTYVLSQETRKGGLSQLQREYKKRQKQKALVTNT